ncbi:helix-turn-helix domain-containing protein [Shimia marina]|uniref:Putative transcriptional regulator n=1 Tax=Shimia marina TaxID=321267 RepID=A0A0P1FG81_9RHOB|nr:helix-turn-helix transcriptional regulator [Shimia marina]CUH52717.1 putative transcriptional regulator [Shimia marina]SFE82792.1 Helix-turn-helix domain-containing protein [Shimia marina]
MAIKKLVGQNLKRFREAAEMFQEVLAFECDLRRTYISGVERGIRNPTVVVLGRLAEPLGVEPWQLLAPEE